MFLGKGVLGVGLYPTIRGFRDNPQEFFFKSTSMGSNIDYITTTTVEIVMEFVFFSIKDS